jgi:hypothetical protein
MTIAAQHATITRVIRREWFDNSETDLIYEIAHIRAMIGHQLAYLDYWIVRHRREASTVP